VLKRGRRLRPPDTIKECKVKHQRSREGLSDFKRGKRKGWASPRGSGEGGKGGEIRPSAHRSTSTGERRRVKCSRLLQGRRRAKASHRFLEVKKNFLTHRRPGKERREGGGVWQVHINPKAEVRREGKRGEQLLNY